MSLYAQAFDHGRKAWESLAPVMASMFVHMMPARTRLYFWRGLAASMTGTMQVSIGHDGARAVLAEMQQALEVPGARERMELIRTDFQTLQ